MRTRFISAIALVVCLFSAGSVGAATYIVPTDDQLRDRADAVVVGRVLRVDDRLGGDLPLTAAFLVVEEVVKGAVAPGEEIEVRQFGGITSGGQRGVVAGAAEFVPGERVLVFLNYGAERTWFTSHMALGKFTFARRDGREVLVRNLDGITLVNVGDASAESTRVAESFLTYLRGNGRQFQTITAAERMPITVTAAPSAFSLRHGANGPPLRWRIFDGGGKVFFHTSGRQTGQTNPEFSVDAALAAWSFVEPSDIQMARAIPSAAGSPFVSDNLSHVFFDSPLPTNGICDQALACSLAWASDDPAKEHNHPRSNERFRTIFEADVYVSANSWSKQLFEEILTHEIGHGLGFRHSNQGTPSSSSAVMASFVSGAFGTNLQSWDREAAQTVYGPGPPCVPISITTHPKSTTIPSGQQTQLSVQVSGSDPVYQWYLGDSPDISQPIAGATQSSFVTPPLTAEKRFWVRVTNSCTPGGVNSNTAIVSVCTLPKITAQPQSQAVAPGGTVTIKVEHTGTGPFAYEWYEGSSGDTSRRRFESNSATFTSLPLSSNTSFWVRVRDACGYVDSAAAIITVGQCAKPVFTVQPSNQSATAGQSVQLTTQTTGAAPITYQWFEGNAGDTSKPIAGATSNTLNTPPLAKTTHFWVRATNSCGSTDSAAALINVACTPIFEPRLSGLPLVLSNERYQVSISNSLATQHEIQESTDRNPATATTTTVNDSVAEFVHAVGTATRYYYRARSISACNGEKGPYSPWFDLVVTPLPSPNDPEPHLSVSDTRTTPVSFQLFVPSPQTAGKNALDTNFTASTNKAWLTVTPPSGTIPPGGTTVTVTANPASLPPGTNTGNVTVTNSSTGQTIASPPVSVSRVSPVSPGTRSAPPSDALILPVAHAAGSGGSMYESDIRLMNLSASDVQYQLTFTPSGGSGTQNGYRTAINLRAGESVALDDIVKAFFGQGAAAGESVTGVLEIRAIGSASPKLSPQAALSSTIASSRTFNLTPNGTFGQALRGMPFSRFIGKAASGPRRLLNLQQIAQTAQYRTNFGVVEAAGEPATVAVRAFSANGQKLDEFTMSLQPSDHQQINRLLAVRGPSVTSAARLEVEPLSTTGRIKAYVSVLDQGTNDAMIIDSLEVATLSANRYVLPGIARTADSAPQQPGWQSDVRLFNPSAAPVSASLVFFPAGVPGGALTREVTINPGEVKVLDDVLLTTFGVGNAEGALHVVTPTAVSLHATAHTYTDQLPGGTRGHFVGALTSNDGIGVGDRPFQILHLEESPQYRADVVLAELSGAAAIVEVSGTVVDSKIEAKAQVPLQPFEYTNLRSLLANLGFGSTSDARVSVRVISGSGRVFALGVLTDKRSNDTTTIEAQ